MLYPELGAYVSRRLAELDHIPLERKGRLDGLARYVREALNAERTAQLVFICTQNSRRSHMAQIWAQVAAHYYGLPRVRTYSGGTEPTAFHPNAVQSLQGAGFRIPKVKDGANPRYHVRFCESVAPLEVFSKTISDPENPSSDFCAVMTCAQADEACPFVAGASARVVIPYEDPKAFDHTAEEARKYAERCRQIAREMLYALAAVKARGQDATP